MVALIAFVVACLLAFALGCALLVDPKATWNRVITVGLDAPKADDLETSWGAMRVLGGLFVAFSSAFLCVVVVAWLAD